MSGGGTDLQQQLPLWYPIRRSRRFSIVTVRLLNAALLVLQRHCRQTEEERGGVVIIIISYCIVRNLQNTLQCKLSADPWGSSLAGSSHDAPASRRRPSAEQRQQQQENVKAQTDVGRTAMLCVTLFPTDPKSARQLQKKCVQLWPKRKLQVGKKKKKNLRS